MDLIKPAISKAIRKRTNRGMTGSDALKEVNELLEVTTFQALATTRNFEQIEAAVIKALQQ